MKLRQLGGLGVDLLCMLVPLLMVGMLGCATTGAPFSERVAGHAAEGAVQESLEVMARPQNQARLAGILGSPPMQAALRDTTASMVAGVFDGVALAGADGGLPGMPEDLGRSIGASIERDIVPAAARLTHSSVDAALDAMLAERHAARVEELIERVSAAAAAGLTKGLADDLAPALAAAIEQDLGPALATAIEDDVLPAVGRGVQKPEVQQAIIDSTASIGVGAALGAERALEGSRERRGDGTNGVTLFGRTIAVGLLIATLAAIAFAVALVVLAVMLVRASRRQRSMYEDSRRREQLLLELFQRRAESDTEHQLITSEPTVS